jgi:aromatic-L-amino-acid decarboxylase
VGSDAIGRTVSDSPLELGSAERRALGDEAVQFLDRFLAARPSAPASRPAPDARTLADLRQAPGEHPLPLTDLLASISTVAEDGLDTAAGSHLSYVPNGGIYSAAVGEFLAAGINRFTGGVHGAPAAVAMEQGVIEWILSLFGMEDGGGGVLLSGGSMANFTALVTARERFGDDFSGGVVYTSERSHHSVRKAARLAGIANVREIGADEALRLDLAALERAIEADQQAGLRPLAIVGSAGTTDTGTIDPLGELAELAGRHAAWFHVDGAYGGFFQLTARGAGRLQGIELADSITLDAHKSLFLPYGIGCLMVRDVTTLSDAHQDRGSYMQDVPEFAGLPSFFALSPELTRPFRGLPVWLALHLHGVAAFRAELDRMLDLTEHAQRRIEAMDRVEAVTEPDLSVVSFGSRHGDDDSRFLFDLLNAGGEIHISSTTIDGRFVLRMAMLNPRTTMGHVDIALDLIESAPPR